MAEAGNDTFRQISDSLNEIARVLRQQQPDGSFAQMFGNASNPSIGRTELAVVAERLAARFSTISIKGTETGFNRFKEYPAFLHIVRNTMITNLNPQNPMIAQAFLTTMYGMDAYIDQYSPDLSSVSGRASAITRRLNTLESQVGSAEERSNGVTEKVNTILAAHEAAENLPATMTQLRKIQAELTSVADIVGKTEVEVNAASEEIVKIKEGLAKSEEEAASVLERARTAYAASTSVGLAAAFAKRSAALNISVITWTVGLVIALVCGAVFGTQEIQSLADVLQNGSDKKAPLATHTLLSLLSITGPVWFAWLATKQIGQRFRLAEDYAFKASVSQAYEGYRREAARVDEDLERDLLASALSRLDEQPLRLIETNSYGSPWHELASSEVVKAALRKVPEFPAQVKKLAQEKVSKTKKIVGDQQADPDAEA